MPNLGTNVQKPKKPKKNPDLVIVNEYRDVVSFWFEEEIVEVNMAGCFPFYPSDWSYYSFSAGYKRHIRNGFTLTEKSIQILKSKYASWALEKELSL
jgi:hypothetical protein